MAIALRPQICGVTSPYVLFRVILCATKSFMPRPLAPDADNATDIVLY